MCSPLGGRCGLRLLTLALPRSAGVEEGSASLCCEGKFSLEILHLHPLSGSTKLRVSVGKQASGGPWCVPVYW